VSVWRAFLWAIAGITGVVGIGGIVVILFALLYQWLGGAWAFGVFAISCVVAIVTWIIYVCNQPVDEDDQGW
jgi:apolipoprotein N-acyltransferase